MAKRGMSEVVVIVLMIVISIVAILIFWMLLRNFLMNSGDIQFYTVDVKITNVKFVNSGTLISQNIDGSGNITITVKLISMNGNFSSLRFIFDTGTEGTFDKTITNPSELPKEFEDKVYSFRLVNAYFDNAKDINGDGVFNLTDLTNFTESYYGKYCNETPNPELCQEIKTKNPNSGGGVLNIFDKNWLNRLFSTGLIKSVKLVPYIRLKSGKEVPADSSVYQIN